MKRIFFLLLLVLVQSIAASLQIQENSRERFSFAWDMEDLSVDDTADTQSAISFKDQNVELGDSGQAVIPAFSFYIGFPPKGDIHVSFTPLRARSISLKHPLKVLKAAKRIVRYPDLHFSDIWLSDGRPSILGHISTRQFIIKPFLYDEKTNTVVVLEKGSCRMEFTSSGQTPGITPSLQTDYARMVSRLILNYDIASQWAMPVPRLKKRKSGEEFPLTPNKTLISFTIGDGHDDINEGTIKENGIIKISGDILQKLGTTVVPINQVALYGSYKGEMPLRTPAISDLPDGVTEIPLMRFDLNANSVVDPEDYVIAYVTGSSDWAWNNERHEYDFNLNRYEDYRHYWITLKRSGAGASVRPMPMVSEGATMSSYKNHVLFKESKEISHEGGNVERGEKSGLDWRWELLTSSLPLFSYQVILPGIDTGKPAQLKINLGKSSGMPVVEVLFSDVAVCTLGNSYQWYSFNYTGDHTLKLQGKNFVQNDEYVEIESFEFKYDAKLDLAMHNGSMTVFSPETGTTVNYQLSNLPAELVYIFRIDANENVSLVDTLRAQKGSSYVWSDSAGMGIRYYICAQSAIHATPSCLLQSPQQADEITLYNLRSTDNPSMNMADYLIISHPDFIQQSLRLAKHKRNVRRFSYPKVVDINDVYREFSGGNLDPAGIRNFLLYAHTQWGVKPDYVVLMGKGHFNFKSINTPPDPVFIPTSQSYERCIEDFFAYLDPGANQDSSVIPAPSVFIGRIPCINTDQAKQAVDKIIEVEDPSVADLGEWRNRGILVNDDDKQVDNNKLVPDPLGTDHRDASDKVGAVISSQWPSIDIRKVNLFDYPANSLCYKPEARDALINDINNGVSFVNYFGHGSPSLWTDEHIFDLAAAAILHNEKHYPVISSFSCAVGRFDQPSPYRCLSGVLALASKSGAIAAISSMREAYSENNKQLAVAFYGNLFDSSRVGVSLGEAYTEAKIIVRDQNSQIYSYLGDPSIRFVHPLHRIVLDITDKTGRSLDTLKALQAITIKGSISKRDQMTVDAGYGSKEKPAFIRISFFNPPIILQREGSGTDTIPGTPIFTGQSEVKNGLFEQSLHLPRNVIFRKPGAKAIAFSWQGSDNGLGYKPIIFNGFDSISSVDTIGPTIALRPLYDDQEESSAINSKNKIAFLTGKFQATLPFKCEVNVFDSSGIDVAGVGPDEGLTIEIDGVLSKQNINNKFRFDGGDYRKGNAAIEFGEGQLQAGTYTLWASAQDLAGNITRQNFILEISQNQEVSINHVFNYPNPVKMGQSTSFYFDLSKTAGVTSTIKVYSMSGKLLWAFYGAHSGHVFNCRDQTGKLLGPNVYLYQLIVKDIYYQKTVKSKIQKLLIHPPR